MICFLKIKIRHQPVVFILTHEWELPKASLSAVNIYVIHTW